MNKVINEDLSHYECLYTYNSNKVNILKEIYADNPYNARVYFLNEPYGYSNTRIMLFEKKNKDFSIVHYERCYGISKTNKIYNREKKVWTIYYSKGLLWFKDSRGVRNLVKSHFEMFNIEVSNILKSYFIKRLPWVEMVFNESIGDRITFNKIIKNKLYSLKKLTRSYYKLPYPQCKILENNKYNINTSAIIKNREYFINVESLSEEFIQSPVFNDTIRMACILNKHINCSWSLRRLKEVHDDWAEEITTILYENTPDRVLTIDNIFNEFSEYSNYPIFTNTKDLIHEGRIQNHCVASYINTVDSGICAIYRVKDYTLELRKTSNGALYISQCRGYSNKDCPKEEMKQINNYLEKFNKEKGLLDLTESQLNVNDFFL